MSRAMSLLASGMMMSAGLNSYSYPTISQSSPIYYPTKHTVSTYRAQQRLAKARRRAKQ